MCSRRGDADHGGSIDLQSIRRLVIGCAAKLSNTAQIASAVSLLAASAPHLLEGSKAQPRGISKELPGPTWGRCTGRRNMKGAASALRPCLQSRWEPSDGFSDSLYARRVLARMWQARRCAVRH
jgi:hypothetical protein